MDRFARVTFVTALSILAAENALPCRGAVYNWNSSLNTWNTPGAWSPTTVPGPAHIALIQNGGTDIIPSGVAAVCNEVSMGAAASGAIQLQPGSLRSTDGGFAIFGSPVVPETDAVPVPEPDTLILLLAAAAGGLVMSLRLNLTGRRVSSGNRSCGMRVVDPSLR